MFYKLTYIEMEELLNKLIEKGWKPRNKDYTDVVVYDWIVRFEWKIDCIETFRTLTSKESWLWQFVCENGMVDKNYNERCNNDISIWVIRKDYYEDKEYQYRLIESALCDEDKLEDFILDNIRIEWTK